MSALSPGASPTFCILPWVHQCIWANGNIYPCSLARLASLGNVRTDALPDCWNAPALRRLRLRMLAGEKSPECALCYIRERVGLPSMRQEVNEKFSGCLSLAAGTNADGTLAGFHPLYFNVSFSNLCNHRCRICLPERSSVWGKHLVVAGGGPGELRRLIEPWLSGLDEIKFEGGEPLLMEDHYRVLDELLRRGRERTRIDYVTNFSTVELGDWDAMRLWDRFESVNVGASLDGMGRRAEYMRCGQDWSRVLALRERMFSVCPRARFLARFTLNVMNALHLPDFHMEWLRRGYIDADGLQMRTLILPPEYHIQALPGAMKRRVAERYERHCEALLRFLGRGAERPAALFRGAVAFMMERDLSEELPRFCEVTRALDAERGESFAEIFPEMASLMGER